MTALEVMHWEVLPQPAFRTDLAPSYFRLFDSLKEAVGGRRFTDDDEDSCCATMTGQATTNSF